MRVVSFAVLVTSSLLFAGCAASSSSSSNDVAAGAQNLQGVTDSTGGIRGVIVDARIVPVAGAVIAISPGQTSAKSDAGGLFNFTGLKPGDYLLKVTKPGFESGTTTTTVVAGVKDPKVVRVLINQVASLKPYYEPLTLNGFYECGFSFGQTGNPVITDQCDMAVRTAYDMQNGTQLCDPLFGFCAPGSNPLPKPIYPRNVEANNVNTQYFDVAGDVQSITQQSYWEDANVKTLMTTLSSTPIANSCDCSDTDYMFKFLEPGQLSRLDLSKNGTSDYDGPSKNPHVVPVNLHVASRGFLNWESVSYTTNLKFQVVTVLFHNYEAQDGFDFAKIDTFPPPK